MKVSETWCSLNGSQDEVRLKVESKTTLSGFFFDTYKEDNQGQIIVAIETLSEEPFTEFTSEVEINLPDSGNTINFRFDMSQMEGRWEEIADRVKSTITPIDEPDPIKEAQNWDNLEKTLLKGYQSKATDLAMKVARLDFMMTSITQ